jgi:predicted cobalt transporter CbtA
LQVPYGLGRHTDTIDRSLLIEFNKFSFIQSIVPLMGGIGFLKIAIALELMKLRGNALAWYNHVLWGLIGELQIRSSIFLGHLSLTSLLRP